MVRATWNGVVLAESDDTVVVEGNHYFPPDALDRAYFAPSDHESVCPWKGQASYHDIVVDGWRAPAGSTIGRRCARRAPCPSRGRRPAASGGARIGAGRRG